MNQLWADHETLERLQQDVQTTLDHLGERIAAQVRDVELLDDRDKRTSEYLDQLRIMQADMLAALDYWKGRLPDEREYRASRIAADRATARKP